MPRTSAAALEMRPYQTPPKPAKIEFPDEIVSVEERELYARILAANPSAHLFNAAVEPLAVQFVRHIVSANKIAKAIRDTDDPKLLVSLTKAQKDETMALSSLSVKLKFSPSSTSNHRGNRTRTNDAPKPWEFGG